jgi:tetratricopeptide (TPR) repeat protein
MATGIAIKPITSKPPVVIAGLTVLAVLGFLFVNRLSTRFRLQEQALGRRMYQEGLAEQRAGRPDRAIEDFRAALTYDHDQYPYQLSLARALRDTGHTAESETYLLNLWEQSPQDVAVNLALGRLAAREGQLDKALQYYHNAIYGVWASSPDANRLNAWFELIEFLLRQSARPQAQAELIALSAELPQRSDLQLRVANMFAQAQDYEHALLLYQRVLQLDRGSVTALTGAGEAAFALGRYRTADRHLQTAVKANPQDEHAAELLKTSNLVLEADPFGQRIYGAERNRRLHAAFKAAGERLKACAGSKRIDLTTQGKLSADVESSALPSLNRRWIHMKRKVDRLGQVSSDETQDEIMTLVFDIEQQTAQQCGSPTGLDQALLILSQNPNGVER